MQSIGSCNDISLQNALGSSCIANPSSCIQARAGVPSWNAKIVAACFSSGENQRLAFATADRVGVLMYEAPGAFVISNVGEVTLVEVFSSFIFLVS